jgi:hypothetical protein
MQNGGKGRKSVRQGRVICLAISFGSWPAITAKKRIEARSDIMEFGLNEWVIASYFLGVFFGILLAWLMWGDNGGKL